MKESTKKYLKLGGKVFAPVAIVLISLFAPQQYKQEAINIVKAIAPIVDTITGELTNDY